MSDLFLLARCAHSTWNQFIQERVWGSREGRARLEVSFPLSGQVPTDLLMLLTLQAKLGQCWRNGGWRMRQREGVEVSITQMICDDERLYWVTEDNTVRVVQLPGLQLECELDLGYWRNSVTVDMHHLYVSTMRGDIKIFRKSDWSLSDSVKIPDDHGPDSVWLPIKHGVIIWQPFTSSISLLSNPSDQEGGWTIKPFLIESRPLVNCVAVKDDLIALEYGSSTKIRKIQEPGTLYTLMEEGAMTEAMVLAPPFLLAVGGLQSQLATRNGVRVWNYHTGLQIRHLQFNLFRFNLLSFDTIKTNGKQLVVKKKSFCKNGDEFIFVLDLVEMCNKEIEDEKIWKEVRISERGEERVDTCNVFLNKTCLIIAREKITGLEV